MISQELKKKIGNLPDSPGVYLFLDSEKRLLYVGKATSLHDRVKSYFSRNLMDARGPLIAKMVSEIAEIKFIPTDSVLEALILEANEIKRHQPYYNSREKDDKSYNYVVITKEDFPRVIVGRGKNLSASPREASAKWGPFPHSGELREALKIIRRIFPYSDSCTPCEALLARRSLGVAGAKKGRSCKPCFNAQIGLCPGPCAGWIDRKTYQKTIRHIELFFEGKKSVLIHELEREMKSLAKEQRFEEAGEVRRQIFALDHIQDVALIKNDLKLKANSQKLEASFRIEAYDIAHLAGKEVVGVMVVIEDGELSKSQYRKFKIKADKNDDLGNLREVLGRRLDHPEWSLPKLVVVDGGTLQYRVAKELLERRGLRIGVVSVVKDQRHKAKTILGPKKYLKYQQAIFRANSEAHRFAINYHRKLRGKGFRI